MFAMQFEIGKTSECDMFLGGGGERRGCKPTHYDTCRHK